MKTKRIFFMTSMPIILAMCSIFTIYDCANAAARVAVRGTVTTARKSVTANVQKVETVDEEPAEENTVDEEPVVLNKSSQFDTVMDEVMSEASNDNSFAAEIRRQRAAIAATESKNSAEDSLNKAMRAGSNTCDIDLRKCMTATCGNGFVKCALDGDTDFGDKLNKCKRESNCSSNEFSLFSKEIKDDRDINARLASYNDVIDCGNQYNACIVNACGTTYSKCLGKKNADAAIEKCKTIATECTESDSGLVARFGTAIGKLRESAESDVVADEKKLYDLRDSMRKACTTLGAAFDERSFDCVYTVNFFAGDNQDTPTASRKAYAGDTFTCMQEWFGVNATTFKENAYRETRSQTAASSAMLGAGLGTAAGLITSGAINRALDTQKAKKELDKEKKELGLDDKSLKEADCRKRNGNYKASACYCGSVMMLKNDSCGTDGKIVRGGAKDTNAGGTSGNANSAGNANSTGNANNAGGTNTTTTNTTPTNKKAPGTKCTTVIGKGEGTYDGNGKCVLTICTAANYVVNPKNKHECILDPETNINQKVANSNKEIKENMKKTNDKVKASLEKTKSKLENDKNLQLKGMACTTRIENALYAVWEDDAGQKCTLKSCKLGYEKVGNLCNKKQSTE